MKWSIISITGSSLIAFGLYIGFDLVIRLDDFKVDKSEIVFNLPDWVSEKGQYEINNLLLLDDNQTIFDKNLTENIAKSYKDNPLLKDVVSVTKKFPNKIKVALSLRKPVAVVKCKGNLFLVDDEGVKLPAKYYDWPKKGDNCVHISIDKFEDFPKGGNQWKDRRILAGIDLLKFLKNNNAIALLDIREIDVSNVGKRYSNRKSDIVIWTKNGIKIKWGCSELCGEFDEILDEEKLRNLFSVAKATGKRFDGLEYVDVRWSKPVAKSK